MLVEQFIKAALESIKNLLETNSGDGNSSQLKAAVMLQLYIGEAIKLLPEDKKKHFGQLFSINRNVVAHGNLFGLIDCGFGSDRESITRYIQDSARICDDCIHRMTGGHELNSEAKINMHIPRPNLRSNKNIYLLSDLLARESNWNLQSTSTVDNLCVIFNFLQLSELLIANNDDLCMSIAQFQQVKALREFIAHPKYLLQGNGLDEIIDNHYGRVVNKHDLPGVVSMASAMATECIKRIDENIFSKTNHFGHLNLIFEEELVLAEESLNYDGLKASINLSLRTYEKLVKLIRSITSLSINSEELCLERDNISTVHREESENNLQRMKTAIAKADEGILTQDELKQAQENFHVVDFTTLAQAYLEKLNPLLLKVQTNVELCDNDVVELAAANQILNELKRQSRKTIAQSLQYCLSEVSLYRPDKLVDVISSVGGRKFIEKYLPEINLLMVMIFSKDELESRVVPDLLALGFSLDLSQLSEALNLYHKLLAAKTIGDKSLKIIKDHLLCVLTFDSLEVLIEHYGPVVMDMAAKFEPMLFSDFIGIYPELFEPLNERVLSLCCQEIDCFVFNLRKAQSWNNLKIFLLHPTFNPNIIYKRPLAESIFVQLLGARTSFTINDSKTGVVIGKETLHSVPSRIFGEFLQRDDIEIINQYETSGCTPLHLLFMLHFYRQDPVERINVAEKIKLLLADPRVDLHQPMKRNQITDSYEHMTPMMSVVVIQDVDLLDMLLAAAKSRGEGDIHQMLHSRLTHNEQLMLSLIKAETVDLIKSRYPEVSKSLHAISKVGNIKNLIKIAKRNHGAQAHSPIFIVTDEGMIDLPAYIKKRTTAGVQISIQEYMMKRCDTEKKLAIIRRLLEEQARLLVKRLRSLSDSPLHQQESKEISTRLCKILQRLKTIDREPIEAATTSFGDAIKVLTLDNRYQDSLSKLCKR